MTLPSVIDRLRDTGADDTVTLTADGDEYSGEVTHYHRTPAEVCDGVPIRGSVAISIDADNPTVGEHDLPGHALEVRVTERRPGRWGDATVRVWDPVIDDDNTIVRDEWTDLGELEDVEVDDV